MLTALKRKKKSNYLTFFFDPNVGAFFVPRSAAKDFLKHCLIYQHESWGLSQARFYKMEDNGIKILSNEELLLCMQYKNSTDPEAFNGLSPEMVNALLNKNVKKIVDNKAANISDLVTKLSLNELNQINSSQNLKSILKCNKNLTLENNVKISTLTTEQQQLLTHPDFHKKINSGKLSFDRFVEIVESKATEAGNYPKLLHSLSLSMIEEEIDSPDVEA